MKEIIVNQSNASDIVTLAKIHHVALPDDFLPSLGRSFLEKAYYPSALNSMHAATLVARDQGQVVGFVTIAHNSPQFTRDVVSNSWIKISLYALRTFVLHPSIFTKSIEVLWAALFSKPDPIRSEIVFIAVDPDYHRHGIGSRLVRSSLEYLASQGIHECRTKTLARNNSVIKMYEKLGWRVREKFKLIGNTYVTIVLEGKNV